MTLTAAAFGVVRAMQGLKMFRNKFPRRREQQIAEMRVHRDNVVYKMGLVVTRDGKTFHPYFPWIYSLRPAEDQTELIALLHAYGQRPESEWFPKDRYLPLVSVEFPPLPELPEAAPLFARDGGLPESNA